MQSEGSTNPYRMRREPEPTPSRSGCGWLVVCMILAALLGFTWLGILGMTAMGLAMPQVSGSDFWEEHIIKKGQSEDRIALIEAEGLISNLALEPSGMTMVKSIKAQLELAAEDDSIRGVLLQIDSPGGEVLASDEIYREIQSFQERSGKPVVASLSSLAASGGYYIAAPCRWIVANELTITGSIGVILHNYNYRGLMDKVGIRPQVFKSGRFKDMLSGDKPPDEILPESKAMIQEMVDETFARFKSVVREGRNQAQAQNGGQGKALVRNWEDSADGRILSGRQAFELGFVDELGNLDQAFSRVQMLLGISESSLIEYRRPFSFGNFFRFFGKAEDPEIKISLGLDLPKLRAGRLYFISFHCIE